ncbi:hypothetical protein [Nitrosopumilus spindle-shaped virus]|uniref:Uncharacterized protein n=1 Tax=Nitrosopumilus spindle-shaped virus TaxID=2508184 RepID=A0A514K387_9VIRU|nr:hypothetical protein [Nitrosopumilus spindle-shaped virus]
MSLQKQVSYSKLELILGFIGIFSIGMVLANFVN